MSRLLRTPDRALDACSVAGCDRKSESRGFCNKHYKRFRQYGDPLHEYRGPARTFLEDVAVIFKGDECLIWPFARSVGYARIRIDGKCHNVSRLVCEMTNGAPPTDTHQAAHSCGNGHLGCVNPMHLRWATPAENNADRFLHDTVLFGEDAPGAKLSEDQVREIQALKGKRPQIRIAKDFGISAGHVSYIQNQKTWRHLTKDSEGGCDAR